MAERTPRALTPGPSPTGGGERGGERGGVSRGADDAADAGSGDGEVAAWLRRAYVAHAVAGLLPARRNAVAKRALDLALSLPLLVVALPLLGALALAVRLGWPGRLVGAPAESAWRPHRKPPSPPLFARQRYAGRGGRVFVGASLPALQATRLRRLARLPLLFNVVRGDMSLVGPRPMRYDEWAALAKYDGVGAQSALACLYVKPGLVGPWMLHRASGEAGLDDGLPVAADANLFYVARGSFMSDLSIVARTPLALLRTGQ